MGEKQIRVRDAGVLLEAGIAELRADAEKTSPSAQILLGAAENMYRAVGDSFNAGVARKWLNSVKKEPAL